MALSTADKLKIKPGMKLVALHAPADFEQSLKPLPKGVSIVSAGAGDQVHWFVRNRQEMEKELNKVLRMLKNDMLCWIYYPKGTSKIQTDLTRDKGWDELLRHDELQWINLISLNDTWSAFGMRLKGEKEAKKEVKTERRVIFDYVDPATKTVTIPEDLAKAFRKEKKAAEYFNGLAFSHRKEYVEWIVTAKKEETRAQRIAGTIERLNKQWKNPRNL